MVQMKKQDIKNDTEETNIAIHIQLRKLNLSGMEKDMMGERVRIN